MSETIYRAPDPLEIPAATEVYVTARNEMALRNGRAVPAVERWAENHRAYTHILRTGIFRVAERDGRLVGVCCGFVRDGLWFLSGYWVLPELQNQGIGRPMLESVWSAGRELGADTCFVWSSVDPPAMAAYMRLGMLPGSQNLTFSGATGQMRLPSVPGAYATRPLAPEAAADIDRQVRGTGRLIDHQYWAADPDRQGYLVLRGGTPCGYFYVTAAGNATPAAWTDPADGEAVLTLACRAALDRAATATLILPGPNHLGIRFALRSGLHLRAFSHLLTTRPFGHLDRYVASGPLLY